MAPQVSFIVLSFNYAHYIGQTIDSILKQTMGDFELIVIDDNSRDNSVEVVKTFDDPRIKLIRNEKNLGGAGSFNKAFQHSSGTFISNVDADDWIEPEKTEKQLQAAQEHSADIVGTWVNYVDESGSLHPNSEALEVIASRQADYNLPSTWIVQNSFCRSSTLIKRSFHEKFGLMDPELVRAPDFELWLRALSGGQRFHMVQEKLTNYRLHSGGVTHADPIGSYLEIAYTFRKNMLPLLNKWGDQKSKAELFDWFMVAPQALELPPKQRFRVLGYLASANRELSYREFRDWIMVDSNQESENAEEIGRNIACIFRYGAASAKLIEERRYSVKLEEARDWWQKKSNEWEMSFRESRQKCDTLKADLRAARRAAAIAEKSAKAAIAQQQSSGTGLKGKIRRILQLVK
ncbi:glycosyltransferase family 2 protein [Microvirga lenta]|uniref:glycosyltransferase family 2 protein n=1 Tax=Microvirga lenta TaxID=2881337 RepID=UPI001CFF599B|nr:glycosyltransferase family 2 protein [Microvirga lenta]MCB5176439.1 glycosyltransferase [Microvirga lenta]